MNGIMVDPNKINFAQYLEDQSFLEAQSIKPAQAFNDDVGDLADFGDVMTGATLPWGKTKECTRIDDGKLSIWAGENGSGKSLLLGQVITGLMLQGRSATIASLEMHPKQTPSYPRTAASSHTRPRNLGQAPQLRVGTCG